MRVGVEREPPPEEQRRVIDRPAQNLEPGPARFRLKGQRPSGPLRRGPDEAEHDGKHRDQLAPGDLGRWHEPEINRQCLRRKHFPDWGMTLDSAAWKSAGPANLCCHTIRDARATIRPCRRRSENDLVKANPLIGIIAFTRPRCSPGEGGIGARRAQSVLALKAYSFRRATGWQYAFAHAWQVRPVVGFRESR